MKLHSLADLAEHLVYEIVPRLEDGFLNWYKNQSFAKKTSIFLVYNCAVLFVVVFTMTSVVQESVLSSFFQGPFHGCCSELDEAARPAGALLRGSPGDERLLAVGQ